MGLFDRLLGSRSASVKVSGQSDSAKPKKEETPTFFLDPDSSSSLGDVSYMRRANTIRHTFPGNADSPGDKEMVVAVDSMDAKLEKMTPGLAGIDPNSSGDVNLTGGIPKPVRKTFAQQISPAELGQRIKGAAVTGVNTPGGPAARKKDQGGTQPMITQQGTGEKPGDTDPFKAMARDLNV